MREGWPEVAAFSDTVMRVGLAGGTLAYRDQELTPYRSGRAEQVWMNLDYLGGGGLSGGRCRVRDLNPRPSVYKTAALPLC